jgi:hypothetical protein
LRRFGHTHLVEIRQAPDTRGALGGVVLRIGKFLPGDGIPVALPADDSALAQFLDDLIVPAQAALGPRLLGFGDLAR